MDLNVPYSEKDEAKRLGARWDPGRRCWYVPEGVDTGPFSRWIPRDAGRGFNLRASDAYVVRSPAQCWRCAAPITVIGFLLAPGFEVNDAWENSDDGDVDLWNAYEDWAFAHYIEKLSPAAARAATAAAPTYRLDFSKTTQSRYWANHCQSCGMLQGDFNLFCEPGGAFLPMTQDEALSKRATPLGFPFEAAADFSYGIDVAGAIPGIGTLRRPGGREDRHAGARPAPLPPRGSRSLWSRLASLLDDRKG